MRWSVLWADAPRNATAAVRADGGVRQCDMGALGAI